MAHKKGAGSSKNGRESHSKRLGIKIFGGQNAIAGNIIVRQRGTKHHPDKNVGLGKDHTIFAMVDGKVVFRKKADNKSYVSVIPFAAEDLNVLFGGDIHKGGVIPKRCGGRQRVARRSFSIRSTPATRRKGFT